MADRFRDEILDHVPVQAVLLRRHPIRCSRSDSCDRAVYEVDLPRKSGEAFSHLGSYSFELSRAQIVERRMTPDWIVEALNIAGNSYFGIAPCLEYRSPDQL